MASFGSFETEREVYSDPIYTVYSAIRSGDSKADYAIKVFSIQSMPLEPASAEELAPLLGEIENSRTDAIRIQAKAAATSPFIAPVLLTGQDERGVWYVTRFFPRSVNRIISGRVALAGDALRHIVTAMARGAHDLKKACGRSHGGILPSNVQISRSDRLNDAEVVLSDPVPGGTDQAARFELSDLNAIGRILLQMVSQRALAESDFLLLPVLMSAEWTRAFGAEAETWLTICNRLLDPGLSLANYSLEQLVADLAALEPKQRFSPKWAIAAGAVVVAGLGVLLLVKAFSGHANKGQADNHTNDKIPEVHPAKLADVWLADFDRADGEVKTNPELLPIFAALRDNPGSENFAPELRNWWTSRPAGLPAVSNLPAHDVLEAAIDAELNKSPAVDFSTNLVDSLQKRVRFRNELGKTVASLASRWQPVDDKLSTARKSWAQSVPSREVVRAVVDRDFRRMLGKGAASASLAAYKSSFDRAETEMAKIDYGPPQKWAGLPAQKQSDELDALLKTADAGGVVQSYDDWRRTFDSEHIIDGQVLKNTKGWPPDLDAFEAKVGDLEKALDEKGYPAASLPQSKSELEGFKTSLTNFRRDKMLIESKARDASTRADNDAVSRDSQNLVRDFETASGKIDAANKSAISLVGTAAAKAKELADLELAKNKLAEGDYDRVLDICKKWQGSQLFESTRVSAADLKARLARYRDGLGAGKIDEIIADRNLPNIPVFTDLRYKAELFGWARTNFDNAEYGFLSETKLKPYAKDEPFASLITQGTQENTLLNQARNYQANKDAINAAKFVTGLDAKVSAKPKFREVLVWANAKINRDTDYASAQTNYTACHFSEALTLCAKYQNANPKDGEFDDLAKKITADQDVFNRLSIALRDGKYAEVLKPESARGNNTCITMVIDQAKAENDFLTRLQACTNPASPNLQNATNIFGEMFAKRLGDATNKPPFRPIVAWAGAQSEADQAMRKTQQDAVDGLDKQLEGWLVKFSVLPSKQVRFPDFKHTTIESMFDGDATNGKMRAISGSVPGPAVTQIQKIVDNLEESYKAVEKKYQRKLLDQAGPWPQRSDTRQDLFKKLRSNVSNSS